STTGCWNETDLVSISSFFLSSAPADAARHASPRTRAAEHAPLRIPDSFRCDSGRRGVPPTTPALGMLKAAGSGIKTLRRQLKRAAGNRPYKTLAPSCPFLALWLAAAKYHSTRRERRLRPRSNHWSLDSMDDLMPILFAIGFFAVTLLG